MCMASLASPEELQEHFEKDHSLPTESETSLQVVYANARCSHPVDSCHMLLFLES